MSLLEGFGGRANVTLRDLGGRRCKPALRSAHMLHVEINTDEYGCNLTMKINSSHVEIKFTHFVSTTLDINRFLKNYSSSSERKHSIVVDPHIRALSEIGSLLHAH